MESFKQYLLTEMPHVLSVDFSFPKQVLHDQNKDLLRYSSSIEHLTYNNRTIEILQHLSRKSDHTLVRYLAVDRETRKIVAYTEGRVPKNNIGFTSLYVWNDPDKVPGIVRYIMFTHILPAYKKIFSDQHQSTEGKAFWKKIIDAALKEPNKYTLQIFHDNVVEPFSIKKYDSYYSNSKDTLKDSTANKSNIQFILSLKK